MASHIIGARNGQAAYARVVEHVLSHGTWRSPRDKRTLDAGFTVIELTWPLNALAVGTGRDLNKNIAAAEAVQLIGAFSSPHLLTKANPSFEQFAEPDGSFHGAYGSRIKYQVYGVVAKLKEDPQSRQAVITLWDPVLDNTPHRNDYPCTVALQFEVHDGALCMNTFMRSNDVWLGLPYDLFQFTQLQCTVANILELDYGWYRHTTLSLHIYENDIEKAGRVGQPVDFTWQPCGLGGRGEDIVTVMKRARQLTVPGYAHGPSVLTQSEEWYRNRFESYLGVGGAVMQ